MVFDFQFIPSAEASIVTLMKSIDRVIINPIIFFLFACAMVYFIYGLTQYLLSPGNEEVHKKSKAQMLWGVVGLFIMVAVFGIMRLILNTVGENNIKIQNNGDYEVNAIALDNTTSKVGEINQGLLNQDNSDTPGWINSFNEVSTSNNSVSSTAGDFATPTNPSGKTPASFTTSPFPEVIKNGFCWRKPIMARQSTEYKALELVKINARADYLMENNLDDTTTDKRWPTSYGMLTAYNPADKFTYVWMDARGPINGGTAEDCNLATIPVPQAQSKKQSKLIGQYHPDSEYYRAVDSGVSTILTEARNTAITNALIEIAAQGSISDIGTIQYSILAETYFPADEETGQIDYWVAIESPRRN